MLINTWRKYTLGKIKAQIATGDLWRKPDILKFGPITNNKVSVTGSVKVV